MKQEVAVSETSEAGNSCGVCPLTGRQNFQNIVKVLHEFSGKFTSQMLMRRRVSVFIKGKKETLGAVLGDSPPISKRAHV